MLLDREREFEWLADAYRKNEAALGIVYGRRRLGKTFLVKNFIKDKPHFYFLAKQQNISLEMERFKNKFAKKFNTYLDASDWEGLFTQIVNNIIRKKNKKFIIVIDEFPYWIQKNKEIVSEMQYLWDEILSTQNIMLILLGSYVSVMEQDVLGYKSPLYGRRTFQINLQPMGIEALRDFFPRQNIEELIKIYGAVDTIPFYLTQFNRNASFRKNLERFFDPSSVLYQDAEILLSLELREYNTYLNIMKAIHEGSTKIGEIASKARVDVTNMPKYLRTLTGMRLVQRNKPVTASQKEKNFVYELSDNYFKFWLTFVYPYKEEIEEAPEQHKSRVLEEYTSYMGKVFEEFCLKITRKIFKEFLQVGKWWHKDKEIDVVGLNDAKREILFGEVKWKENINAEAILAELKEKAALVKWHNNDRVEKYVIFGKSFKRRAVDKNTHCFSLQDLNKFFS